ADASANRMSVGTSPRPRDAMEIAKVGVDDRCVTHAIEVHATASFILRISMQPGTVYHEVIHRAAKSAGDPDQAVGTQDSGGASNFQAHEAVMVGAGSKEKRTVAAGLKHFHFRHHVAWIGAAVLR